jgi:hypothetical protein
MPSAIEPAAPWIDRRRHQTVSIVLHERVTEVVASAPQFGDAFDDPDLDGSEFVPQRFHWERGDHEQHGDWDDA